MGWYTAVWKVLSTSSPYYPHHSYPSTKQMPKSMEGIDPILEYENKLGPSSATGQLHELAHVT